MNAEEGLNESKTRASLRVFARLRVRNGLGEVLVENHGFDSRHGGKAMQRSRALNALVRLPALALPGECRAARRYLRERTKAFAPERPAGMRPPRRPASVRELTGTSVHRPRRARCSGGAYGPCVRAAGRSRAAAA